MITLRNDLDQVVTQGNWNQVLKYVTDNYDSHSATCLEISGEFEFNGTYFYTE